jgi:hypothetical protein
MLLLIATLAAPITVNVAPDYSLDHATWWLVGVTAAVVICTLLTVWDGWRKGRLQDVRWNLEDKKHAERWLAEDKQREEDAKPKTFVELATYENDPFRLVFVVYNLGNHSFLIDKLVIKVEARRTTITAPHFAPQIVTPGNWAPIEFDQHLILSPNGSNTPSEEAYGIIVIKGATGLPLEVKSDWLHVFYPQPPRPDRPLSWNMGRSNQPQGTVSQQLRILPGPPSESA